MTQQNEITNLVREADDQKTTETLYSIYKFGRTGSHSEKQDNTL